MISSFLKVTEPSENSQPKRRGNEGGKDEIEEGRRQATERDREREITGQQSGGYKESLRTKCCIKRRRKVVKKVVQ